jgi:hypothetical protein
MVIATLERQKMPPTTLKHIRGSELPPSLQSRFRVKPHQLLKVTVEVEEDNSEYDTLNVGDDIVEGLREIVEAKTQGKKLSNARDFLRTL